MRQLCLFYVNIALLRSASALLLEAEIINLPGDITKEIHVNKPFFTPLCLEVDIA